MYLGSHSIRFADSMHVSFESFIKSGCIISKFLFESYANSPTRILSISIPDHNTDDLKTIDKTLPVISVEENPISKLFIFNRGALTEADVKYVCEIRYRTLKDGDIF